MTMRSLAVVILLATALPAGAQPAGSISDCERIKNDLAYNQCLASFGPRVGQRAPRVQAGQDPESSVAEASPGRGRPVVRGRRGRQAASFDIVSGGSREVRRSKVSRGKSYRTRSYRSRRYGRRR